MGGQPVGFRRPSLVFKLGHNGLRLAAAAGYQFGVIGFAVMEDTLVSEKRQAGCERNRCFTQFFLS